MLLSKTPTWLLHSMTTILTFTVAVKRSVRLLSRQTKELSAPLCLWVGTASKLQKHSWDLQDLSSVSPSCQRNSFSFSVEKNCFSGLQKLLSVSWLEQFPSALESRQTPMRCRKRAQILKISGSFLQPTKRVHLPSTRGSKCELIAKHPDCNHLITGGGHFKWLEVLYRPQSTLSEAIITSGGH